MKKTVVRYGIYGAVTICALFLLGWLTPDFDFQTQEIIGYISMVVALSFVYFGIKHFRDKENKGTVNFGKALGIGILISLITAVAFGLMDVIYVEYLNPDFTDNYYDHVVEGTKNTLSPEEFKLKLEELEVQKAQFSNPIFTFLIMALTVFVIGFIISLISSLILQRK